MKKSMTILLSVLLVVCFSTFVQAQCGMYCQPWTEDENSQEESGSALEQQGSDMVDEHQSDVVGDVGFSMEEEGSLDQLESQMDDK